MLTQDKLAKLCMWLTDNLAELQADEGAAILYQDNANSKYSVRFLIHYMPTAGGKQFCMRQIHFGRGVGSGIYMGTTFTEVIAYVSRILVNYNKPVLTPAATAKLRAKFGLSSSSPDDLTFVMGRLENVMDKLYA